MERWGPGMNSVAKSIHQPEIATTVREKELPLLLFRSFFVTSAYTLPYLSCIQPREDKIPNCPQQDIPISPKE